MLGRKEQTFEQDLQGRWLENDGMTRRVEKTHRQRNAECERCLDFYECPRT